MIHKEEPLDRARASLLEEYHALIPAKPERCLFFDIETTGLKADTAFVFLIGCICYDGKEWMLHQYLIRYVQEEKQLLAAFFALAEGCEALVHFNGTTFDLPFLKKRAVTEHMEDPLSELASVDLYQLLRPLKKILHLTHMNQKSLELETGWEREDTLSGKDMVSNFWSYEASGDRKYEKLLLSHNHDDLTGMFEILRLYSYLSLADGRILPDTVRAEAGDELRLHFRPTLPLPKRLASSFETGEGLAIRLEAEDSKGLICVPLYEGELSYFFSDYKNYYYLPEEGRAIHKSVAAYVDRSYREPAKPQNCCVKKMGRFLWEPKPTFTPALRLNYEAADSYFELTEDFLKDQKAAASYAQMLLPCFFS